MTAEIWRKIEDVRHRNMLRRVEAIRKKHANLIVQQNRNRYDHMDNIDPDAWRTVNGAKVNIGEGGEIKAGMGGKYTGQKIGDIGKGGNESASNFNIADEPTIKKLEAESRANFAKMSESEDHAIMAYTHGIEPIFMELNSELRNSAETGVALPDTGQVKSRFLEEAGFEMSVAETVSHIENVIDRFPISEDIVTFRGVPAEFAPTQAPGEVFAGNMFYSTSLREETANTFGNHMLEIRVPRGGPGFYVGNNGMKIGEAELLLSSQAQYRIVSQAGNRTILEVVNDRTN